MKGKSSGLSFPKSRRPGRPEPWDLIAAALRGSVPEYPSDPGPDFSERILEASAVHGVQALLDAALSASVEATSWPPDLRQRLRSTTREQAVRELLIERELDRLLRVLSQAGIRSVLLKGTPLAYTVYPQPYLRTRGDTDLLIPAAQRDLADDVLRRARYQAGESAGGGLASYERTYSKTDTAGVEHVLDLHWQLSNSQIYARSFNFAELYAASIPVPALGAFARMPSPLYGLLIACLHRISHLHAPYYVGGVPYLEANRLIWLYDIHLLINRLTPADWADFVGLATQKGFRAICLDGLQAAHTALGTPIPPWVVGRLGAAGPRELSAGYLSSSSWRHDVLELAALDSWGQRIQLIRERVFPPGDYVLRKYGTRNRGLLPWLYLRRAVGGLLKRMRA